MTDIPTNEPLQVTAGDSVTWKRSFSDYPAADGWVLTYALQHSSNTKITLTASADGDDHLVSEVAATTAAWGPGIYSWQAYVTKAPDRYQVDTGTLEILPDLSALTNYDGRSHVKKTLDAIEAVIEGRATKDQESYSFSTGGGSRSLSRTPLADLIMLRTKYKFLYESELNAERVAAGLGTNKKIVTRF